MEERGGEYPKENILKKGFQSVYLILLKALPYKRFCSQEVRIFSLKFVNKSFKTNIWTNLSHILG